jgi:hypothetical protein
MLHEKFQLEKATHYLIPLIWLSGKDKRTETENISFCKGLRRAEG